MAESTGKVIKLPRREQSADGVIRMSATYVDDTGKLWIVGLSQIRQHAPKLCDDLVTNLAKAVEAVVENRRKQS